MSYPLVRDRALAEREKVARPETEERNELGKPMLARYSTCYLADVRGFQVFSSVTIKDSRRMQLLTQAAVKDSAAMKQIAYLTMLFLPATFLAVSTWFLPACLPYEAYTYFHHDIDGLRDEHPRSN